jgi:hypothetical protein
MPFIIFPLFQERRWEAVLFYGKEALEKGIDGSKKVKLLCNLALGYARLGYIQQSFEYIKEATSLDVEGDHEWFIELYQDKLKKKIKEPILLKEAKEKRRAVSIPDSRQVKDDAMDGKCVVVDLVEDVKHFYGQHDAITLERKEAEILGYLIDNQLHSCSKATIEEAVWLDQQVAGSTVKRYIASIRRKLTKAMNREDIKEQVLTTTDNGYMWKAEMKSIVLRRR